MNRREFLKISAKSSSALLASTALGCATIPRTSRNESVIVVGAGIAGLTAARELEALGRRVIVLEGSRRIGGRIYPSRDLCPPGALGASPIPRSQHNPPVPLPQHTAPGVSPRAVGPPSRMGGGLSNCRLLCVTEMNSREDIDALVSTLSEVA